MTARLDVLGAPCFVEAAHAIPLVGVVVSIRTGSQHDPEGMDGLARVMLRMLRRGCAGYDAQRLEERIDVLGSELGMVASASTLTLHGRVIKPNAAAFCDLLASMLGAPTFTDEEVGRLLRETAAELTEARDSDPALAHIAFRRAVFGGEHPFGRGSSGRISTVARIDADAVRAFHRAHVLRSNVVLGFSGDVTEAEAGALSHRILGALADGPHPPDAILPPPVARGRRLVFVDKPARTQTQILCGGLGTHPHDPDHVALAAGTAIFGGTFTSRLMKEVRSKRGWSYGASARVAIERARHAFTMGTFPAATDAAACLALEIDLLERWVRGGVTPREVAFIKKFLTRSHAFDVDTPSKRLHEALDVELLHLPATYHSGYLDHVRGITKDAVDQAVTTRISTDDLTIVVVGTARDILDAVKAAVPALASTEVLPFDRD